MRVEAGKVNARSVFMVVKGKRDRLDRAVAFRVGQLCGPPLRVQVSRLAESKGMQSGIEIRQLKRSCLGYPLG